jgi:hypothetical protein
LRRRDEPWYGAKVLRSTKKRGNPILRRADLPRAWHAFLIALGLLLAQGPMVFHLLLVPHATCEHGELIEGRFEASETVARSAPESASGSSIDSGHGARADHDHCDALAVRHRVPEMGASIAAASLLATIDIETCGAGGEARPLPLLALAPKGSPPPT